MNPINRDRLSKLADSYGGDLRRWPWAEREAAQAAVARDPAARALLDEALRLDEMLDAWRATHPSHALRTAVLESAGAGLPTPRARWRDRLTVWVSGAGLATAALCGVLVGASLTPSPPRFGDFEALTASIYPDPAGPLAGPSESNVT